MKRAGGSLQREALGFERQVTAEQGAADSLFTNRRVMLDGAEEFVAWAWNQFIPGTI
jgi:hypothetical protein